MKKTKILAMAPYEGLRDLMKSVAAERNDIDLHVYIGDLKAGVDLALSIQYLESYDVIISRGGTADMLQKVMNIPLIEIKLTEYDLMRSIKLTKTYNGKFAIVGFPNITQGTDMICDLLQCNIDTYTVTNSEKVSELIVHLKSLGYSLLVGDAVTVSTAKRYGLNGILITSGRESIRAAFDEAVKLSKTLEFFKKKSDLYRNMLHNSNQTILAFNANKELVYSNLSYTQNELHILQNKLAPYIQKTIFEKDIYLMLKIDDYIWNIKGSVIDTKSDPKFVAFYSNKLFDVSGQDADFYRIQNSTDLEDSVILNFYLSTKATRRIMENISKLGTKKLPILIYGEKGTGKDVTAYRIHASSNIKSRPFITINCKNINDKQISHLLYKENSLLAENDITIYFKNIHCLNTTNQLKLVTYIEDSLLNKRNRIIYSTEKSIRGISNSILLDYLTGNSTQSCLLVTLPPLRELKEEIASLISIYISQLNLELGKQIAGVSEEAMDLLKNFNWKFNFYQFANVLKKLSLITDTTLITAKDTDTILAEENRFSNFKESNVSKFSGTLDDITSEIIQTVLEEEEMNQSKAAKRLGISRSTLWRKLKKPISLP